MISALFQARANRKCSAIAAEFNMQQERHAFFVQCQNLYGNAFLGLRGITPIISGRTNIPKVQRN